MAHITITIRTITIRNGIGNCQQIILFLNREFAEYVLKLNHLNLFQTNKTNRWKRSISRCVFVFNKIDHSEDFFLNSKQNIIWVGLKICEGYRIYLSKHEEIHQIVSSVYFLFSWSRANAILHSKIQWFLYFFYWQLFLCYYKFIYYVLNLKIDVLLLSFAIWTIFLAELEIIVILLFIQLSTFIFVFFLSV